jgi:hypothetical protein
MTRVQRVFADLIRVGSLDPRHPRAINDLLLSFSASRISREAAKESSFNFAPSREAKS